MGLPIVYRRGHRFFVIMIFFLSLKVILILANYTDPDEKQHSGSSLLPEYPFRGFQYIKG